MGRRRKDFSPVAKARAGMPPSVRMVPKPVHVVDAVMILLAEGTSRFAALHQYYRLTRESATDDPSPPDDVAASAEL